MFGNIEQSNVVAYSFADPANPKVIFAIHSGLADLSASFGNRNKYVCLSQDELEQQVKKLSQQLSDSDVDTLSGPQVELQRLNFAKQILLNFQNLELSKNLPLNLDGLYLMEGLNPQDTKAVVSAIEKQTQKSAQNQLENLLVPPDFISFVGFVFDVTLKSVWRQQDEGRTSIKSYDLNDLIEIKDKYTEARDIYACAQPQGYNPYSDLTRLMPDALKVLSFFEGNNEAAKRFSDAICILNGEWEVDDNIYNDGLGRPLLKLKINCGRQEFELYLDSEQMADFFGRLNHVQQHFSEALMKTIVSQSFYNAASKIYSTVDMIQKGYIDMTRAPFSKRTPLPDLSF